MGAAVASADAALSAQVLGLPSASGYNRQGTQMVSE